MLFSTVEPVSLLGLLVSRLGFCPVITLVAAPSPLPPPRPDCLVGLERTPLRVDGDFGAARLV